MGRGPTGPLPLEGVICLTGPKLFRSKYAAYQVLVRPPRKVWNADGTVVIDSFPALTAEFGQHGGEYDWIDDTGTTRKGAIIHGYFFDLDAAQEQNGWSDEETELVQKVLLAQCKKAPGDVWVHETAKPSAPWPTYDMTHHNKVASLAEELGLLDEAIAYESATKNRESVIAQLQDRKSVISAAAEMTAV